jgi:hypothetical protein
VVAFWNLGSCISNDIGILLLVGTAPCVDEMEQDQCNTTRDVEAKQSIYSKSGREVGIGILGILGVPEFMRSLKIR